MLEVSVNCSELHHEQCRRSTGSREAERTCPSQEQGWESYVQSDWDRVGTMRAWNPYETGSQDPPFLKPIHGFHPELWLQRHRCGSSKGDSQRQTPSLLSPGPVPPAGCPPLAPLSTEAELITTTSGRPGECDHSRLSSQQLQEKGTPHCGLSMTAREDTPTAKPGRPSMLLGTRVSGGEAAGEATLTGKTSTELSDWATGRASEWATEDEDCRQDSHFSLTHFRL